ncbi:MULTISPECIES: ABC transporter ATP-binding protein [unclassified Mesorhizobium]|uniref:ABC transporter ATP-binding protein n=1 Tax=unclassified Mesorhizobium TaxID=325217 RepID=UPI000F75EF25|nr:MULTISPECIES: sn-glycerol-3-phosphate ABC transporter ATP-binding protein UgpC [unclassified Mesorhizobium]AZO25783.1 sn-glycerol-3-phosphate ABC transporter ATP-binding protein UgpC [Mesorhizobium sp. M1E.F.Ca.ET.045.02.1.1]RUW34839.1 sn-glycerol-3-phosphate ABC transporter ATP-binding protein UgpC [Mesorhizobium sp. M1E.F.Ca.ET.041.01.1.1]RUW85774.1 sn-glycerol-3-phosphate ABC transporter ATP-binding protein UgpC [Mesorhizobium sp. M1E.F.Ca.ET.063.01.1.1]RWD88843.1 MAG: sn-glycerol-3-phosp
MTGIALSGVSKHFGAVEVIRDVSLDIEPGELVVFLGPSGSGKTTLLRMIAGLESIDEGTLTIDGVRSENLAPGRRNVAMVFQNYALYPHMTVSENMAFGLRNIRVAPDVIRQRIAEAARILEIEALLHRRPSQLSGGQRQRVAIGRAIVKEPKAFLFDEPLSNLDAALRARTRVELAELHQRLKSTMIYVTHDQVEAMTLADRIVILNNCRIEQMGKPVEVYSRPASRFVAAFVGSPAMNILPVTVSGSGDRLNARLTDGSLVELPGGPVNMDWRELGVRPESLTVVAEGGDAFATATVVERLGERTLIYARLADGTQVTAQDRGLSSVKPGDAVRLKFDTTALHLFAADGSTWHAHADGA